jgi:hypothetical protein
LGIFDDPRDCSLGSNNNTNVRPFTPWRFERITFAGKSSKEATESIGLVAENSGDVLPEADDGFVSIFGPLDVDRVGNFNECQRQVAAGVLQTFAPTRDREGLAWSAPAQNIRGFSLTGQYQLWQPSHVAPVRKAIAPLNAGNRLLAARQRKHGGAGPKAMRQNR